MRIKLKKHVTIHTKKETREFLNNKKDWTDEEKVMFVKFMLKL